MTPYDIGMRYAHVIREDPRPGKDHPFIQWCFTLCGWEADTRDEVPWCSAWLQHPFWETRQPRSKSARARSWLKVGVPVELEKAERGFDVVILKRGGGNQPGPENTTATGHVGFFAGLDGSNVLVLGGNQSDTISVAPFPRSRVLGVRRCIGGADL